MQHPEKNLLPAKITGGDWIFLRTPWFLAQIHHSCHSLSNCEEFLPWKFHGPRIILKCLLKKSVEQVKKNMLSDSFLDVSQFHTWWFNKCHLVSICFPGRNLPPGCTDFAHPAPITLPPQWRLSPSQLGTPNHLRKLIHDEMDKEMDKNSKFY